MKFKKYFNNIGHVQIAGVPDRHEPDESEIDCGYLMRLLDEMGYDGWVGCEYRPRRSTEEGLGWMRRSVEDGARMKVLITGGAGFLGRRLATKLLERGTLKGADDKDATIDQIVLVDIVQGDVASRQARSTHRRRYRRPGFSEKCDRREHGFDLPSCCDRQRSGRGGLRSGDADQRRCVAAIARHLPRTRSPPEVRLCKLGGGVWRRAASAGARHDRARAAVFLRNAKSGDRTFRQRLHAQGLHRRPRVAIADDQRAAGASERCGFVVCKRHHSRAIERRAGDLPGQREHALMAGCRRKRSSNRWCLDTTLQPRRTRAHAETSMCRDCRSRSATWSPRCERVAGADVVNRIEWKADPRIERIVSTWPGALDSRRALTLGFPRDENFDAVIRQYVRDEMSNPR